MSIESDVLSYHIPCGYMIVCHSSENDGDYSQTNILGGLTKEAAQFKYDLLYLLRYEEVGGNLYEPTSQELERLEDAVCSVIDHYGDDIVGVGYSWDEVLFNETTKLVGTSETYYTRLVDDVQIYYVPFDVEFPNVTDQFAQ